MERDLKAEIHDIERMAIEANAISARDIIRKTEIVSQRIAKLVPDWLHGQPLPFGYWCDTVMVIDPLDGKGRQYRALLRKDPLGAREGLPLIMNMCVATSQTRWNKYRCTNLNIGAAITLLSEIRVGLLSSLAEWMRTQIELVGDGTMGLDGLEAAMTGQAYPDE